MPNTRPRRRSPRCLGLLLAALYCAARGIAYLPVTDTPSGLPSGLELLSAVIPLEVWAALWLVAAAFCAVLAFRQQDALAWGALTGMMAAWGVAYLIGWVVSLTTGEPTREWLNATTYLLPAVIIAALTAPRVEVADG